MGNCEINWAVTFGLKTIKRRNILQSLHNITGWLALSEFEILFTGSTILGWVIA
jgi:hypothetical protein